GYSCIRYYPYCPIVRLLVVIPKANIDFNYLCYVFTILLEQGLGTSIPQLTVPMIKEKAIPLSPSFGAKAYCRENRKIIGTSGEIKNGKLTKNF
ncbi:MAG: hypothetical protein LBJ67_12045, partial [Planctomycetaceae bacterium]|nr:hypothetical protein [Planctomycetaceae bacterium]